MNTKFFLAVVSSFILHPSAFGQGALTPPGAPAPTMKTLAQLDAKLDPRTPISSVPFNITQAGSYYLTTNVTTTVGNAIVITANGVTLDLSGFTIASTVASAANGGAAILLQGTATAGLSDITIFNGHIRGGVTNNGNGVYSGNGFAYGIFYSSTAPGNVLVSKVSVSGCLLYGIYLNTIEAAVVEGCTVRTVGNNGIVASTIKSCVAVDCGITAIYGSQVSDCRGESTGGGSGINASTAQNCYGYTTGGGSGLIASTAQNCYGYSGSGIGLYANYTASGCFGYSSSGTGLSAYNASFCTATRSGGTAIHATIANGCIAQGGTNIVTYKYNMP